MKKFVTAKEFLIALSSEAAVGAVGFAANPILPKQTSSWVVLVSTILILLFVPLAAILTVRTLALVRLARTYRERNMHTHDLAHFTRDLIVKVGTPIPAYEGPPKKAGERFPRPHPALDNNKILIREMLEECVDIFQTIVPKGVKVTAALRDLRSDGGYHTVLRAGPHDPTRANTSKALYKDNSVILTRLRESFQRKCCVLLTGSARGEHWWEPQVNDTFGDDRCVLMGVVMTRSWDATGFTDNRHAWILSVNGNRENAFTADDIPLMQACTDLFSAAANALVRAEPAARSEACIVAA